MKKPDQSQALLTIEVETNDESAWLRKADSLMEKGRYEEALPYYREASRRSLRILSQAYQCQDEDIMYLMQQKAEHCRQAIVECQRRLDD